MYVYICVCVCPGDVLKSSYSKGALEDGALFLTFQVVCSTSKV
jgi:hypothetical protein